MVTAFSPSRSWFAPSQTANATGMRPLLAESLIADSSLERSRGAQSRPRMDARGITEAELVEGTHKSTLAELTTWTQWADKVLVF